ncbi:MAG: VacJ family lipoprotein [Pseudomonadota bacterium]
MTLRQFVNFFAMMAVFGAISACTATGPREGFAASDPYEPTNRAIHEFNVELDRFVLRPVSQGYDIVTPTLVQHLVGNGLSHLDLTNDFANYVLQGDVDRALETLGRFTLNTIIGAAGLLDPATEFGLPKEDTDFGITLGKYGVEEGPYVVLPFLGPSTVRDTGGFVVDRAFSPTTYIGIFADGELIADVAGPAVTGMAVIDGRASNAELIDNVLYNSPDSYVTIRSAYLQRRRAKIAGDQGALDQLPDIFDEPALQR